LFYENTVFIDNGNFEIYFLLKEIPIQAGNIEVRFLFTVGFLN